MDKNTSNVVFWIVFGSFILVSFGGILWVFRARSRAILRKWAGENGFEILERKQEFLGTGPFKPWTNSRNQTIFFLRVRGRDGRERSCWARCGSYFGGVFFSNAIEIRWDEL